MSQKKADHVEAIGNSGYAGHLTWPKDTPD
jgi:hypothetical protein